MHFSSYNYRTNSHIELKNLDKIYENDNIHQIHEIEIDKPISCCTRVYFGEFHSRIVVLGRHFSFDTHI